MRRPIVDLPTFVAADSNAFLSLSREKKTCRRLKSVLGGGMKIKTIGLILALCFFAGAACFAADDRRWARGS